MYSQPQKGSDCDFPSIMEVCHDISLKEENSGISKTGQSGAIANSCISVQISSLMFTARNYLREEKSKIYNFMIFSCYNYLKI